MDGRLGHPGQVQMQPVLTLIEYPGYVEDQDKALSTLSYIPPVNMLGLNSCSESF